VFPFVRAEHIAEERPHPTFLHTLSPLGASGVLIVTSMLYVTVNVLTACRHGSSSGHSVQPLARFIDIGVHFDVPPSNAVVVSPRSERSAPVVGDRAGQVRPGKVVLQRHCPAVC
jgi:hypothetical protein